MFRARIYDLKRLADLLLLLVQESGSALSAVVAVEVVGKEDTRSAVGALLPQALDLSRVLDLVVLEHSKLDLLLLVLVLLGLGVGLWRTSIPTNI